MDYLSVINLVLIRLREDEVSSPFESSYSKLISLFVNETKREVEDTWDWSHLRSTIALTTVSGTQSYSLTGAGPRFRLKQIIDTTNEIELSKVPQKYINRLKDIGTPFNSEPIYWDLFGSDSSGDPTIRLHPVPNGAYALNVYTVVPQGDLGNTDSATVIKVPYWPIVLGAYAKAIDERGDDGGVNYRTAENRFQSSLTDAVAVDAMYFDDETTWTVD